MACTVDPLRLVAWLDGDLRRAPAARLAAHAGACPKCRQRVADLRRQADALRTELRRDVPQDVLARLRHLLPPADTGETWTEVLTLDEVARYLRVALDDLDMVAADLPAFEVAGQVRVRHTELLRWIARREQDYAVQRLRENAVRHIGRRVS
jgi:anti-sigma factor RsiW